MLQAPVEKKKVCSYIFFNFQLKGQIIKGEGDIVVGQEYTDFDKGLEDGIEGAIFGFNFVLASSFRLLDQEYTFSDSDNKRRLSYLRKKRDQLPRRVALADNHRALPVLNRNIPNGVQQPQVSDFVHYEILRTGPKIRDVPTVFKRKTIDNAVMRNQFILSYGVPSNPMTPIVFGAEGKENKTNAQRYPDFFIYRPKKQIVERISHERPTNFQSVLFENLNRIIPTNHVEDIPVQHEAAVHQTKLSQLDTKEEFYRVFENNPVKSAKLFVPSKISKIGRGQLEKPLGLLLVELSYHCSFRKGAPLDGHHVLINWAKTPVRVFGGAILKSVPPFC